MPDAHSNLPPVTTPASSVVEPRRSWRIRCVRDAAILGYAVILAAAFALAFAGHRIEQVRASGETDPLPMFAILLGIPLGISGTCLLALSLLALLIASRFRFRLLHVLFFFAGCGIALIPVTRAARWIADHASRTGGAPLTRFDLMVEGYLPTALPPMYGPPAHGYLHNSYVTFHVDLVVVAFVIPMLAIVAALPTAFSALAARFWRAPRSSGR